MAGTWSCPIVFANLATSFLTFLMILVIGTPVTFICSANTLVKTPFLTLSAGPNLSRACCPVPAEKIIICPVAAEVTISPRQPIGDATLLSESLDAESRRLSDKPLAELLATYHASARSKASSKPKASKAITIVYDRNPLVITIAKSRARNRCEVPACTYEPFESKSGMAYCEVHHIVPLSDGGTDQIENAACLCPTHHRELHHGKNWLALQRSLQAIRNALP